MRNRKLLVVALVLTLVVAVTVGSLALARGKPPKPDPGPLPGPGKCPNAGLECLDVWDPVTCDNGITYSNQCYADRDCATGCVEGGPTQ